MGAEGFDKLVSDFSRFYILTILYEGATHGYGILQKFEKRVGKTISPGLVYPFLQKLEEQDVITYTIEPVGAKERKVYQLTDMGRGLCNQLFKRFAGLVSTAIEPSLDTCAHCGCKVYEGAYMEVIDGVEMSFCCIHCAQSYKQDRGVAHEAPTFLRDNVGGAE